MLLSFYNYILQQNLEIQSTSLEVMKSHSKIRHFRIRF